MPNNMDIQVSGIKCDNPTCDFTDDDARYEDYEQWLNKPCPNCGANLLTEADLETVQLMMELQEIVNSLDLPQDEERFNVPMYMDGSGKVTMGTPEPCKDS